jgi:hypothetical protein
MDYITNFLEPKTLCKLYDITKDYYYLKHVENLLNTKIFSFDYNNINYNNINIVYDNSYILVYDDNNNGFKAKLINNIISIEFKIINDIKSYYIMYKQFKKMFIEFYLHTIKIIKSNNIYCYYKNIKIDNKFSIYCDNRIYKVL